MPAREKWGKFFDEAVYGITQHFTVVQLYVQVGTQFQFAGKVAHHRLKRSRWFPRKRL